MNLTKIVFLTNATSRLSLPVLESLHRSEHFEVTHILFYDTVAASRGRLLSVIKEHGLKKTATKVLGLIFSKLRSRMSRGKQGGASCEYSRQFAELNEIPFTLVRTVNSPDVVEQISQLRPDLLLASSFSQIIRAPLLKTPKLAAANIHMSLLPKYRGPAPAFWALYHGENETGVTIHLMSEGIDDGKIIDQLHLPIAANSDETTLTEQLFELAGEKIESVLVNFVAGETKLQDQDETLASYFSYPSPAQRRELK